MRAGTGDEAFAPAAIASLREEYEVDIETPREGEPGSRRTTIWVVVVNDAPFVRSYRGERGRWFGDLRREPRGAIHAGAVRIPFRCQLVTDRETLAAVDDAFRSKYRRDASTPSMLMPEAVSATLRLLPAAAFL